MNIEEIRKYLEENKDQEDVKNLIAGLKPAPQGIETLLETEDGKRALQPRIDRAVTQAIETYRQKTLPAIVEEEVKKRNPEETPEQKRLRELEDRLNNAENERTKANLLNMAITEATQKGLPIDLASYFVGQDEASTRDNLTRLENAYKAAVTKAVEDKFKQDGRRPSEGGAPDTGVNPWLAETFNLTAQGRLLKDKPELARSYMAAAKLKKK